MPSKTPDNCSARHFRAHFLVKIAPAFLVLLAFPTLAQNSRQHRICKRIESCLADNQDGRAVPRSRRIEGESGSQAIVDYERIYRAINETIRRGT